MHIPDYNYNLQLLNAALPYDCVYVCVVPQVEMLIEQEVHTALKKKESKLQGLIGTIQQLDRAVDYGNSMKKLEVGGSSVVHILN